MSNRLPVPIQAPAPVDPATDAVSLYGSEIELLADLLARIEAARPALERLAAVTALTAPAMTSRQLQTCATRAAAEEQARHLLHLSKLRPLPPLKTPCPVNPTWASGEEG
ncbi:MAG: hypothetical protein Alpg2KO_14450 [Alphaproteobacteria bacterium]